MNPRWTLCAATLLALFRLSAAEAAPPVTSSGTIGRVPRWVNTSELADSSIIEDGTGHIAIGAGINPGITLCIFSTAHLGLFVGTSGGDAIYARSDAVAVSGETSTGTGVVGTTDNISAIRLNTAVLGISPRGDGVFGSSHSKSEQNAGVTPEALGQPEERGIEWVREAERFYPRYR